MTEEKTTPLAGINPDLLDGQDCRPDFDQVKLPDKIPDFLKKTQEPKKEGEA